ncbi:MAG: alpha/beta fold hydrolase, partial [Alphaproteobacteria bacterium]|nr:alpha/beta fold hydrolase [Alphaproteobacteria bacterium]
MPAPDDESGPGSTADIAERCQRLVTEFLTRKAAGSASFDPFNIGNAFLEMTARMMSDPAKMVQAQMSLWQDYLGLWQSTAGSMLGHETAPAATPEARDRRFRDKDWDENALFDFIKQSYLLTARWIQATVQDVHGLDDETKRKVEFFTRQFVNALSPSNFVMTNPEVLRATIESRGENLVRGLANMLEDLERGNGRLAIKMTDLDAFRVGGNIAVTPGKVVFRNDLMELIQYDPATPKVRRRPLLIVPPWINKFYILDLRPENSLIKWAVDQGHTVFVVSWVNPDESLAEKTFDDYMVEGPLAALDAIEKATGEAKINAVGYCVGGTLLACTLAYMAARGDGRIASATFLAAMVDFAEAGELAVFIDEVQVARLEERMKERGYLEGREMAASFNMMRDNDLIWSFVVNNYL